MKKTLCKTIHKFDNSLFIHLEDIVSVNVKKVPTRYLLIVLFRNNNKSYSRDFISEEAANINKDNLIKELEEYYGLCSDK